MTVFSNASGGLRRDRLVDSIGVLHAKGKGAIQLDSLSSASLEIVQF